MLLTWSNNKQILITGTVSIIFRDPPCKDGNVRFTIVSLKAFSNELWILYYVYNFENWLFSIVGSIQKWLEPFCSRIKYRSYKNFTLLNLEKLQYLSYYWSDKGFKGTVVNRTLSLCMEGQSLTYAYIPSKYI